ncbi:MAG TPA: hypothetical protein DD979_07495 [Gammaproteobacteria bacterium]|nr:hypothetical protein [Gammaproteobacteria bacterium]
MNLRKIAKTYAETLPGPVARMVARVPFGLRLGPAYGQARELIAKVEAMEEKARTAWTLEHMRHAVERAYGKHRFYRAFYDRKRYCPSTLKTIAHFQDVPVVTKADLMEFGIDERSSPALGRLKLNTGGTHGEPLEFYVDRQAFAREWAHMHTIWIAHGYDYRHLKLTLRGHNLKDIPLRYNPVHNEYILNTYAPREAVADALAGLADLDNVKWLHGYPSVVADWCGWLHANRLDVFVRFRSSLRGVLLGSEFPAPTYRSTIERTTGAAIIPWYGHSEMCILAPEKGENIYKPMPTYGYAEAVDVDGGQTHLVGTSFWNTASPFIRYDTGDGIEGKTRGHILRRFSITDGRVGEFVTDRRGSSIGLTALIFGRHHPAFEKLRHVQVYQSRAGEIDVLVVPRKPDMAVKDIKDGFDFSAVEMGVSIHVLAEPVRTRSGKITLLVQEKPV